MPGYILFLLVYLLKNKYLIKEEKK